MNSEFQPISPKQKKSAKIINRKNTMNKNESPETCINTIAPANLSNEGL